MLEFRAAEEADVDQLIEFLPDIGLRPLGRNRLRRDFADARMRTRWSWLVERDGVLAGRALWWGRPDAALPVALDALDLAEHVEEPAVVAAELLNTAHAALAEQGVKVPLEYTMQLHRGWRQDAAACAAVGWRRDAGRSAGFSQELERLQYAWTRADTNVPAASGRVSLRPGDDNEFLDLFSQVARGTLDVQTQRAVVEMGEQAQARDDLEFYLGCPGEREWWRVAVLSDGRVAGFVVPSATPYNRNVGYLGVLPALRGQGLIEDLLGAVTRIHAQAGAETITATTDTGNAPMAAAFDRAGYEITEIRLVLSAP